MRRTTKQPDRRLATLAEQTAAGLAERFAQAGITVDMATYATFGPWLTEAFTRLVGERDKAKTEANRARRDAWVAEQRLLTWQEAQERLGLSSKALHVAHELDLVESVPIPNAVSGYAFLPERLLRVHALTAEERTQIAGATLMTRLEAAKYLGISPAVFDRRRSRLAIVPAGTIRGESGWPAYQFRLSNIERLRTEPQAAAAAHNEAGAATIR